MWFECVCVCVCAGSGSHIDWEIILQIFHFLWESRIEWKSKKRNTIQHQTIEKRKKLCYKIYIHLLCFFSLVLFSCWLVRWEFRGFRCLFFQTIWYLFFTYSFVAMIGLNFSFPLKRQVSCFECATPLNQSIFTNPNAVIIYQFMHLLHW